MSAEEKLRELGITLPPVYPPRALYKPIVLDGHTAYLSGHGPVKEDQSLIRGRVGEELDLEAGCAAARLTGLNMLATLREHLGSLDRVVRVLKVLGFVNCTPDFENPPGVINACTELFIQVFGEEAGISARTALGTNSLPGKIPVEIEAIFEIRD